MTDAPGSVRASAIPHGARAIKRLRALPHDRPAHGFHACTMARLRGRAAGPVLSAGSTNVVPDELDQSPYGHDPQSELPHTPVAGIPDAGPSTTRSTAMTRDRGSACTSHVGRLLADPRIWRAVIQVYLPGDELPGGEVPRTRRRFPRTRRRPVQGDLRGAASALGRWISTVRNVLDLAPGRACGASCATDRQSRSASTLTLEAAGPLFGRCRT